MAVRVLLVDDHKLVREGLRRTLTDAGLEVVGEAADGAAGLDMAERLRPHVVLMDVSMPVLDGITATKRMRVRSPETNVVVLTMHADDDLVLTARQAGASGYLLKDASSDEVVTAVRLAAQGRKVLGSTVADAAEIVGPGEAATDRPTAEDIGLTEREVQILQLLADGCSPKEVAEKLFISPKTVRNHLSKAYDKLGVSSRSAAIVAGVKSGVLAID